MENCGGWAKCTIWGVMENPRASDTKDLSEKVVLTSTLSMVIINVCYTTVYSMHCWELMYFFSSINVTCESRLAHRVHFSVCHLIFQPASASGGVLILGTDFWQIILVCPFSNSYCCPGPMSTNILSVWILHLQFVKHKTACKFFLKTLIVLKFALDIISIKVNQLCNICEQLVQCIQSLF